jgi:hypothetical protein
MYLATIRKALTPAVLGIIAVLTQWVASGAFDEAELRTAVAALVTALAVYFMPNEQTPPPVQPGYRSPT